MYHSLSFWTESQDTTSGGRNTWASFGLIPTSRPYVAPPTPKTNYIDIPYSDGKIDVSTFGIDTPVFDNRSGTWEFMVVNSLLSGYPTNKKKVNDGNAFNINKMPNGYFDPYDWEKNYSILLAYFQGENLKVILEDDPSNYYFGKLYIDSLSTEEAYTKFSISYDLEPYRKQRFDSTEEWLWDAIDFEKDIDLLGWNKKEIKKGQTKHLVVHNKGPALYPKITVESAKVEVSEGHYQYAPVTLEVAIFVNGKAKVWYFTSSNSETFTSGKKTATNLIDAVRKKKKSNYSYDYISESLDDFCIPAKSTVDIYITDCKILGVSDSYKSKFTFKYRMETL